MFIFIPPGPAEILRAVQKDHFYCDLLEKHLSNILLKTGGTIVWLRYRYYIAILSKILYYCFTTLVGNQTLGEEYTNIVQVDASLRYEPKFLLRLLMIILEASGSAALEYILNKLHLRVQRNIFLHPDFKQTLLCAISFLKAASPFVIHLHLVIFYWNGVFYNISKRFTGIRYIVTKPWLSRKTPLYGFKILAGLSLFHILVSIMHKAYTSRQTLKEAPISSNQAQSDVTGKCSLCLESRTNTSATTCGHLFCWNCILEWLQGSNQCPICRNFIDGPRIIPLFNYL